jgi:hypothetical protein
MSSPSFQILIRDPDDEYGEKKAMRDVGIVYVEGRSQLALTDDAYRHVVIRAKRRPLVIGRYSVLPFYKELEDDVRYNGFDLINTTEQFRYIADMQNWYQDLKQFTPFTWFSMQEYLADNYEGPVVLKGETNSRRDKWLTHMFANNKEEARVVNGRLLDDGLISQQQIYIRKYEPLHKLIDGINGMPIPNEWRFFVLYGQIIADGYYWSTYAEDISEMPKEKWAERDIVAGVPSIKFPDLNLVREAISIIKHKSNFYVIDVAEKQDGSWCIVELNEGQMSGLNGIDREKFYKKMKKVIENEQNIP